MTDSSKKLIAPNPADQWRVDFAHRLAGVKRHKRQYARYSETWDHDHCAACMAKFAELDGPDILHEGYATGDDDVKGANYEWVCAKCFTELQPVLGWTCDYDA
jgi:hypothetical protein